VNIIEEMECAPIRHTTNAPFICFCTFKGRGLRTLVARACTGFVSIPGGSVAFASVDVEDNERDTFSQAGVDSLNVSVTGGILLWHFLSKQ
jgi:21S rRNA (GM2251-2'-O)-methyltransferase